MKPPPIVPCPNIHALPEPERLWLLGRAAQFDLIEGVEVPTYTYREIARNFTLRRRIRVSRFAVRRFILRQKPELARRRGDPFPLALATRRWIATAVPAD